MIFQHTWQKIMDGSKTQTRRLLKEFDEGWIYDLETSTSPRTYSIVFRNSRQLWQIGKTYAIQPGRGKKAIGYKVLKSICKERLQDISEADIQAEIGSGPFAWPDDGKGYPHYFAYLWDSINGKRPGCAWEDNPEVWVLEFEAVKR